MLSLSLISKENYNEIISRHNDEPDWISEMRKKAISQFNALPSEISPLYSKYTGLRLLEPEKIFFTNAESTTLSDDLKVRMDEVKSNPCLIMYGSSIVHINIPEHLAKSGLIISSIQDAFKNHSEILKRHFENNAGNYGEDRFLALGLSSFQSGFFIYIPKNLIIKEPIRIVYSLKDDNMSSICRNIVISDIGSKATIVQELYSSNNSPNTVTNESKSGNVQETNVFLEKNASKNGNQQCYFEVLECGVKPTAQLEFITLQAMDLSTVNISSRKGFVEQDGKMSWYSGMFGT